MPDTLAVFGALLIILTLCTLVAPTHKRAGLLSAAATHALTQGPAINYVGNPYRMGAYVYVMETSTPSEHDWHGTYIGMQDGYALIRDETTHVVASVNRDQLYATRP